MAKKLSRDQSARQNILSGVKKLARAVKITLGPKGRNVLIENPYGHPESTKDGVTVAKKIHLKDKFENMGAQLVVQAASKTNDSAGDGTTTAVALTEAIYKEGLRYVEAGVDPLALKRGMDKALAVVIKDLEARAIPVASHAEIAQVGAISANNDRHIGNLIADAMEKVGNDGTITIEESKGLETEVTVVKGMQFDKGYLSPYFVTHPEKMSVTLDDAWIFITDAKLSTAKQVIPLLEMLAGQKTKKPCLVIAEDIEGEALTTLVVNKLKGNLSICGVKAPAFGDRRKAILEDIAVLTGATVVTTEMGYTLDKVEVSFLGSAEMIHVHKEETTIAGGKGNKKKLDAYVSSLRHQITSATSDYEKEKLQERLAKLSGGVAVIKIGGASETEVKEIRYRVEDALHATKAAALSGILPGGGTALIRAESALSKNFPEGDEGLGWKVIAQALRVPASAIAFNAGVNGDVVAEAIAKKSDNEGYNALTGVYEDLVKAGVVDPLDVTRNALSNAVSVASMLLTVDVMITDIPSETKKMGPSPGGMPDMGGMPGMGMM